MEALTSREQEVLDLIKRHPESRVQDIAATVGVSRQRIDQIIGHLEGKGHISDTATRRMLLRKQKREEQEYREEIERARQRKLKIRVSWMKRQWKHRYLARVDAGEGRLDHFIPLSGTVCRYQGCTRPVRARGFCNSHYTRLRADGVLWVKRSSKNVCSEKDCILPVYALNRCRNHYAVYRRANPLDSHIPANNKSGYRGVTWSKGTGMWVANIGTKDGQRYLGAFRDPIDAAHAYDAAARLYHGETARLNFPNDHEVFEPRKERQPSVKKAVFYKSRFSQYRGVSWDVDTQRWIASITIRRVKTDLGFFEDEAAAARAYDTAALEHHGDHAVVNFPLRHNQFEVDRTRGG